MARNNKAKIAPKAKKETKPSVAKDASKKPDKKVVAAKPEPMSKD